MQSSKDQKILCPFVNRVSLISSKLKFTKPLLKISFLKRVTNWPSEQVAEKIQQS